MSPRSALEHPASRRPSAAPPGVRGGNGGCQTRLPARTRSRCSRGQVSPKSGQVTSEDSSQGGFSYGSAAFEMILLTQYILAFAFHKHGPRGRVPEPAERDTSSLGSGSAGSAQPHLAPHPRPHLSSPESQGPSLRHGPRWTPCPMLTGGFPRWAASCSDGHVSSESPRPELGRAVLLEETIRHS